MNFAAIVQFIIALPKIWAMFKDILGMVQAREEQKQQEAIDKTKKAKTVEEIKDAVRDRARNP